MVRVEEVEVTPGMAKEWLNSLPENQRKRRDARVAQYARDIVARAWPVTGDTLKISRSGRLIDGQHRAAAIILADTPVRMMVAFDVPDDVMPMLDNGLGRTLGDNLIVTGHPQRMLLSAVVRYVCYWEAGNRLGSGGRGAAPSMPELIARYRQDPDLFATATARGKDIQRARLGQGGAAGTAFFLFVTVAGDDPAHRFFDDLLTGANLAPGDPVLALRNRLTRARFDRLRSAEYLALFIRAWNARREGRKLDTVVIVAGGRRLDNTNFPVPK